MESAVCCRVVWGGMLRLQQDKETFVLLPWGKRQSLPAISLAQVHADLRSSIRPKKGITICQVVATEHSPFPLCPLSCPISLQPSPLHWWASTSSHRPRHSPLVVMARLLAPARLCLQQLKACYAGRTHVLSAYCIYRKGS